MSQALPRAVLILLATGFACAASAQLAIDASPPPVAQTSVSDKSPLAAGLLEWFTIPTVGYAYAGDWSRGVPSALVRFAGIGLSISRLNVSEPGTACDAGCAVGFAMFLGGSVWATIDAARTTDRMNERRRTTSAGLSLLPSVDAGRVGVVARLATRRR